MNIQEFKTYMIGEIMRLVTDTNNENKKYTVIIKAITGVGKTSFACNLVINGLKAGKECRYVSKSAAQRLDAKWKLSQELNVRELPILGSGAFVNENENMYDLLVCDSAERLTEKSGLYGLMGYNQIYEIIKASRVSVFILDDVGQISTNDLGTIENIKKFIAEANSNLFNNKIYEFPKQQLLDTDKGEFLSLINKLLENEMIQHDYKYSANYEVKLFESAMDMKNYNKALPRKILSGYCYDWVSRRENKPDIKLEDGFTGFYETPVPTSYKDIYDSIGTVYMVEGVHYSDIGVIIGKDLTFKDNKILCDPMKHSNMDSGVRKRHDQDNIDQLIKNAYKILLSRGQNSCYIYCEDKDLEKYLKQFFEFIPKV